MSAPIPPKPKQSKITHHNHTFSNTTLPAPFVTHIAINAATHPPCTTELPGLFIHSPTPCPVPLAPPILT